MLDFCFAAGGFTAVQSPGNDAAVVDDQAVAGIEIIKDVGELFMVDTAVSLVQNEQSRSVPGG